MPSRPSMSRPTGGRSYEPLLDGNGETRGREDDAYDREPVRTRRSRLRSRSPLSSAAAENKQRYVMAGFVLIISLVSFVIQTETAVYIQHTLGWKKAYCMLYFTHSSWALLWPAQFLVLRIRKHHVSFSSFMRSHLSLLKSTVQMIQTSQDKEGQSVIMFMIVTTAKLTMALTIAGSTWYIAVNMTTPGDLTAIYNCNAFFAYAFSIPLLKEKPRKDKIIAVIFAIIGVFIVAYGDGAGQGRSDEISQRALGNLIIGSGSVMYGLYEVMYKKLACPPDGTSAGRSAIFANTVASCIGFFTFTVLWVPLPILHLTGLEIFEFPRGEVAWMLAISVFCNALFSGSFLVLISLTSPVLSAVAALLTIFLVSFTDWIVFGTSISAAALAGGLLIIGAFAMLSWATYVELTEEKRKKMDNDVTDDEDED